MKKIYKFVALSCLSFLLLSFTPLIQAQPMSTLPLKAWKSSDNSVTIETSHLKIVVEQLSQIHYRISCYIKQSAETIEYDVIDNGFEKIILVNGREVSRVPVKQPSTPQSSGESSTQSTIYYWWDGIRFVKGLYIKYPHADRDYYGISPFSSWLSAGYKLYHYQIDRATSQALNAGGGAAIGAAIGAIIGGLIGGTAGAVVGAIAGAVITAVMTWSGAVVFLDEWDCIWWWISKAYVQWLINNAPYLYVLYFTLGTSYVIGYAMSAFLINGYLRVGSATFYDAVGAGNP